jgi:N-acyl-D-amino-acid deacylase
MLKRCADPELRKKIVAEAEETMTARFGGAAGVYLPETRQELVDIMREWHVSAGGAEYPARGASPYAHRRPRR